MLHAKTLALLKKVIATIPHDDRGAFREVDLVAKLAEDLHAALPQLTELDAEGWIRAAAAIVEMATEEDGTPANGMLHLPGSEPYPWLPDQLLSDGKGYLIQQENATVGFLQDHAKVLELEAQFAQEELARLED